MSPSLARMIKTFDMVDSFRFIFPSKKVYSHYYTSGQQGQGETRIDRSYNWGEVTVTSAKYEPAAFSDHMAYIVTLRIPNLPTRLHSNCRRHKCLLPSCSMLRRQDCSNHNHNNNYTRNKDRHSYSNHPYHSNHTNHRLH